MGVWSGQPRGSPLDGGPTYGKGTLQGDQVLLDGRDGEVGDGGSAILDDGSDVDELPLDGGLRRMSGGARGAGQAGHTFAAAKISLTECEISGPIPSPSMNETT